LAIPLAAESLANEIGEDHLAKRQLFPSFTEIRDISAHIGAAVAEKAYELGKYNMYLALFFFFNLLALDHRRCAFALAKSTSKLVNMRKFE